MNTIIILGPTGSGKTDIAVEIAKLTDSEIISADSRQVYKHLDIGTNKAGKWQSKKQVRTERGVAQHLTDLIEPSESFSAGSFAKLCEQLIKTPKKRYVIAGGTGLYIQALIDGLAPLPEGCEKTRKTLKDELSRYGIEHLYKKLKKVDEDSAQKNKDNPQRLIRALEVYTLTGTPISQLHKQTVPSKLKFAQFGLWWERDELYSNLDKRTSLMMRSGIIEETEQALKKGFQKDCPGLKSIGYNHIVSYINGRMTKDEAEELFKRDIRRYAKRQVTWFKRDKRIKWIPLSKTPNPKKTAENILKAVNRR